MAKCNVNTQERFADIQMLRYELKGFENLSLTQKIYIYCLSKATLLGRDITFDQQANTTCASVKPWRLYTVIMRVIAKAKISRLSKFI